MGKHDGGDGLVVVAGADDELEGPAAGMGAPGPRGDIELEDDLILAHAALGEGPRLERGEVHHVPETALLVLVGAALLGVGLGPFDALVEDGGRDRGRQASRVAEVTSTRTPSARASARV